MFKGVIMLCYRCIERNEQVGQLMHPSWESRLYEFGLIVGEFLERCNKRGILSVNNSVSELG